MGAGTAALSRRHLCGTGGPNELVEAVFPERGQGAFDLPGDLAAGVINFTPDKITREIDCWDGRHFGLANLTGLRLPPGQFPSDYRESTVGETASR